MTGGVVQMGTPQELFEKPAHTFVGYFIGSPGMNVLDAKVTGNTAVIDGTTIRLVPVINRFPGRSRSVYDLNSPVCRQVMTGWKSKYARLKTWALHKIVRADFFGNEINIIADEGAEISADMNRVTFDPSAINVYANDWRIQGEAA